MNPSLALPARNKRWQKSSVATTVQLHSTESYVRFFKGLNTAYGVLKFATTRKIVIVNTTILFKNDEK